MKLFWKTKKLGLAILAFAALACCTSRQGMQSTNVSYLYNTRDLAPRPRFVTQHQDDETTRVFYRVNTNDLLYVKNPKLKQYEANFEISYMLMSSFEEAEVLDSGAVKLQDQDVQPIQKIIRGYFDLNTKVKNSDEDLVLRLKMTDENRQVQFENFIRIERKADSDRGNFVLTDTLGNALYENHVAQNAPFYLSYSGKPVSHYWVSHYRRDFPLALPPYSSIDQESFELDPDTTYQVRADGIMELKSPGFYHFRTDTSQWSGITVYSFYNEFPYVANRLNLGPPLRYLTTRREYDGLAEVMSEPVALKKEVDDFWLRRSGSLERSKLLLETYYNRVQEANVFFTSYLEGWKTDRGIIYTIYGPPDKVYRSSSGEAWVYGDESSALSYFFRFTKISNPFTSNDYALERSSTYRYGWGQAIEAWRNGHIYNSKDIRREQDEQQQNRYSRGRTPYWY